MWSVVVVLPTVQAEFGVDRAGASLPFTLTMIGFGVGGAIMGRIADKVGIVTAFGGAKSFDDDKLSNCNAKAMAKASGATKLAKQ